MNPNITHLSPPLSVNMEDAWFDIANLDHFWIKRRFEVFQALWKGREMGSDVAEIGCGHGVLLAQIKQAYGVQVDGYDLNELALKQADPGSRLFYYNIHDRLPELKDKYPVIFAFDVIEHLEDDRGFVESVLYHLQPGGRLIINVPANQSLYSKYDRVLGHQRRYDAGMLEKLCVDTELEIETWSYWGFFYLPILLVRQQTIKNVPDADVTKRGFKPPSPLANHLLLTLGRFEWLPNHFAGASLLAILRKSK